MKFLIFLIFLFHQQKEFVNSKDISFDNFKLNSNISLAINSYGKVDSIVNNINEFTGEYFKSYHFKNNLLYVENNRIIGFRIKDINLIKIKNKTITKSFLVNQFPISFHQMTDKKLNSFKVQIGETDSYLIFIFDDFEISEIITYDDY